MKIIIGLGNPGKEYENTRHNAGFRCVDLLREKLGFPQWKPQKKFKAEISEMPLSGEKILLAKPQTFMNLSGETASKLANFYHVEPNNLWLVYDDVDLALGKIRVRLEGSAGSHNGMKSVIVSLGFQNFPRIRIGIESRGVSAAEQQEISSFVLQPFLKEEKKNAEKAIGKAAEALVCALQNGVEKTMEKYN